MTLSDVWAVARSPRGVAAVWALWAWATALAYADTTPSQLDPVTKLIPGTGVAWLWGAAAVLLTIGAVVPSGARDSPTRVDNVARGCRIAGLAMVTGLLIAWGVTYAYDSVHMENRLWVSAKNYLLLALVALANSQTVGRYRREMEPPELPAEEEMPWNRRC